MRYLLAFFFFLMYMGDNLGINVGLAPGLSVKNLFLYLMFAGIAINAAVARNRRIELAGVLAMFTLLILYALFTWVARSFVFVDWHYEIRAGFVSLKSTLVDEFLTLLIFFYGLLYLKHTQWLLGVMLWIVMVGNIITVIDTMNIPDLGILPVPEKGGRFAGFIGQPNAYGQFLVLFLPGCIALFLRQSGFARLLAGVGVFATLLALILTASRGSYAGCIGGGIIAAFYLRRYISGQSMVRAGIAAAVVCIVVLSVTFTMGYADLYLDRFTSIDGNAHVVTSGRTSIWSEALASMMEKPISFLTGYGFYSYDSARIFRLAPHNMYLSFLYNLGAIGLLLFIGIFARVLSTAKAAIGQASDELQSRFIAFTFGVLSFLVAIFFSDYHKSGYLLWAYVGVTMRAAMILLYDQAAERAVMEVRPPARPAVAAGSGGAAGYARRAS